MGTRVKANSVVISSPARWSRPSRSTSRATAAKTARNSTVTPRRPAVSSSMRPKPPSGSRPGPSRSCSDAHAGVADSPSNASELSARTTNVTVSQPVPVSRSSPTAHGRRATSRRAATRKQAGQSTHSAVPAAQCARQRSHARGSMARISTGAKAPMRRKSTEKTSPWASQASRPYKPIMTRV